MRLARWASLAVLGLGLPGLVAAQMAPAPAQRVLEFRFTPTARAQIALWLEQPDGTFVKTLFLTQAVGQRGIGNRPGASQMNSGFHWPYGRREGALPIWAHRRAAAPGAAQWSRVIFQNRLSEGDASQTSPDQSQEDYFCLSFMSKFAEKDALDAVSCASGFNSDKGRFMVAGDVAASYGEPVDNGTRALDLVSLYPPRRDVTRCLGASNCFDAPDVATYVDHARTVMPDIDSVTMATPPGGDVEQSVLFAVPPELPDGDYVAWAEVNTEGDSNPSFTFATPNGPGWDGWAHDYGYSYRGQPSVAFKVPIRIGAAGTFSTAQPIGFGDVAGSGAAGGALHPMDPSITNDPGKAAGSGADRFRLMTGKDYRLRIGVRGGPGSGSPGTGGSGGVGGSGTGAAGAGGGGEPDPCQSAAAPPAEPGDVRVTPVNEDKHSHEWGHLHFVVPASALSIHDYEVRVSESAITTSDPTTFDRASRANVAALEDGMLVVPTAGVAGASVDVDFGHLKPTTTYYVAVRANNLCAVHGPYAVGSFTTTKINFTKLSGCFIATAAFGSSLGPEVEALRVARDVLRPRSAVFATVTDLYYRSGPAAAAVIERSESARAVVRGLLGPIVTMARAAAPVLRGGTSGAAPGY